jgi:uncharacterized membrane protein
MLSVSTHLHPATIHFPLAFLALASVTGLLYLYWQQQTTLAVLTWWGLRLGWLGCGLAVATGLWAQSGLPIQTPYETLLNWHFFTGLALLFVYGTPLYQHWLYQAPRRQKERSRQGLNTVDLLDDPQTKGWLTLCLLAGLLLLLLSGWTGGRLVYEWGVNVG